MKTVLCFGNELVEGDDLAIRVGNRLEGVEVKICRDLDDALVEGDVYILDVVKGIDNVQFIYIDDLKVGKRATMHDFDIGFFLKLMKETGKIKELKIIGIPMGFDEDDALRRVKLLLV